MRFQKINNEYYEFDVNGNKIGIKFSALNNSNISLSLERINNSEIPVNLYKILNTTKKIIQDYIQVNTINEIYFIFHINTIIKKERWLEICKNYLEKHNVKILKFNNSIISFKIEQEINFN